MTAPRWKEPRPGVCRVCGCTDDHACDGGCYWVHLRTLCSSCAGTAADLAFSLRWVERILKSNRVGRILFARDVARGALARRALRLAGAAPAIAMVTAARRSRRSRRR